MCCMAGQGVVPCRWKGTRGSRRAPGHAAGKKSGHSSSWTTDGKKACRSDPSVTIRLQIREAEKEQICRSVWSLPSLWEPLVKLVWEKQFFPAGSGVPPATGHSSWKGAAGGAGRAGGSTVLPRRLAGAFGTGTCVTRLPGVKVFLSCLQSWPRLLEEKQGEAAPPAQTRASTVACFFTVELINTQKK